MVQEQGPPSSPTLVKILQKFLAAMKADEALEDAAAERLDALLQTGRVPKQDEISAALSPETGNYESGSHGDIA